ncbi:MAG: hypothetical protein HQK94_19335, partial [Nitrospirae bacterium]|nr:hypothetical protein [Nitrospirota bacterium]
QKEAEALNAKIGEETKSTEKSEDTTPMPDIASIKDKGKHCKNYYNGA